MATEKQRAANRRNAQKSTGPRSVEGKAVSSQNALKSSIDAKSQVRLLSLPNFASVVNPDARGS
jgi:hypothetical protein